MEPKQAMLEPWKNRAKSLLEARFIERINRFCLLCKTKKGFEVLAHLPNPGRLQELLLPEVKLLLEKHCEESSRKTNYTVVYVEKNGLPVFLHTNRANDIVARLLQSQAIPEFKDSIDFTREVKSESSRFDFLLHRRVGPLYLEVKSCTHFANGIAMFPDAPTSRGKRHIEHLTTLSREKLVETAILFIVHSAKVDYFMPDFHTDLPFAQSLARARSNVSIFAYSLPWTINRNIALPLRKLSIPWEHIERQLDDKGSYILILELQCAKVSKLGSLGSFNFKKGYYLYVGSAMKNLDKRVSRHMRKRKKLFWHIDYLGKLADGIRYQVIRSCSKQECQLSKSLASIFPAGPKGFGSSDCSCKTHLYYSKLDPLKSAAFHSCLEKFRFSLD